MGTIPLMNDLRQFSLVVLGMQSYGEYILELKVAEFWALMNEPLVQFWQTTHLMVGQWLSLEG
jgi:hypothetical protein